MTSWEWREIIAKFDSRCVNCGTKLHKGTRILYRPQSKTAVHILCPPMRPKRDPR